MQCTPDYIVSRRDFDDVISLLHQHREWTVDRRSIQDNERFTADIFKHSRNLRYHILCTLKERGIMLKEEDRVARLFQYGEELVGRECSTDLEVLG